jgi:hypothetical protein
MNRFLLLLLIGLCQSVFGQKTELNQAHRPYSRYEDRSFECSFKTNNKAISEYCEANGKPECINFLSSQFSPDSSYRINLTIYVEKNMIVYEQSLQYIGRYSIGSSGEIILHGRHPFSINSITIKEKKYKHYICTLGYKFELKSDLLSDSSKPSALFAICDGDCEISGK